MSRLEKQYEGYILKIDFPENITKAQRRNFNKKAQKLEKYVLEKQVIEKRRKKQIQIPLLKRISEGVWFQEFPEREEAPFPIFYLVIWARQYKAKFQCWEVKGYDDLEKDVEIAQQLLMKKKRWRRFYF